MDSVAQRLSRTVASRVRSHYLGLLKRGVAAPEAYRLACDEVVELVARAQRTAVEKARFASREVLQGAMQLVTDEAG